jgi:1-phosphofructokinase/tagatose 6-phosphate kinase
MIITVTPNPAWDVTYEVPALTPGEVHRVARVHRRLGGKGVNAARVLAALGHPAVALLPGPDGLGNTADGGLRFDVVPGLPAIRQTLVVQGADGTTTSLWEPGPHAAPETGELLLARMLSWLRPAEAGPADAVPGGRPPGLDPARPGRPAGTGLAVSGSLPLGVGLDPALPAGTGLVVSGSLPLGLDPALPARLAAAALEAGVPALVDASGPALAHAAEVPGVVISPNATELAQLTGSPCDEVTEAVAAARRVVAGGPDVVLATLGEKGMVAATRAGTWRGVLPEPLRGNPTGAGDAAAAAVIAGLARRAPWPEIIRDAVAASAAAVLSPIAGEVSPADYAALRPKVHVSEVS